MKESHTKIKDLKVFISPVHKDSRGYFKETFKKKFFKKTKFVFNCVSSSKKNVLRGMHLQTKYSQGKYLTVLKGEIFDVVIDLRKKSKTFGKHFAIKLSDTNGKSIYIPPGFAHGFVGLKKENIISYSCTNYRAKEFEVGIMWNDANFKIKWPIKKPKQSIKDSNNISFRDYVKLYA